MMAHNEKRLFARLDHAVSRLVGRPIRTGFTAPHVIIAANLTLLLISLLGFHRVTQGDGSGHVIVTLAMNGTVFYSVFVQYRERGNRTPDERENAIRWKSYAIAGWIVTSLVMVWAVLVGQFADNGLWYPTQAKQWPSLGLFIGALTVQISSIVSAWMTPTYAAELLDDD
jgi:hypothetical protein